MKKLLVSLAVCLLISSSNGTCEENKECKISVNSQSIFSNGLKDLDFINQLVKTKYAPFSWKEKIFGWNAEKELQNFRDSLSWYYLKVSHVQDSMVKYFEALRDYHAGIHFFATESSYLPLVLKRAINGNVFVVDIFSPINGLSIGDTLTNGIRFSAQAVLNGSKLKKANKI